MNSDPATDAPKADLPQPADDCRRSPLRIAAGATLIFLLAFAVYWPALRGQFVWDDLLLVDKNPLVKGEAGLRSIWFQADFPLTTLAFWVQWLMWGKNPAGYHIVNVLLHALNAVWVWRVLARLRIPGAWIAGMIFAALPVLSAVRGKPGGRHQQCALVVLAVAGRLSIGAVKQDFDGDVARGAAGLRVVATRAYHAAGSVAHDSIFRSGSPLRVD